jgi:hypothetical protein
MTHLRTFLVLVVSILLFTFSYPGAIAQDTDADGKPVILIYTVENSSGFGGDELSGYAMTEFINSAVNTGKFRVIDRKSIEQIITERGLLNESLMAEVLGADYLIKANIQSFREAGGFINFDLKGKVNFVVTDLTSSIISSKECEAQKYYLGEDDKPRVWRSIIKVIADQYFDWLILPIKGIIADVKDDNLIIDRGSNHGLTGDMYWKYDILGDPIPNPRDPDHPLGHEILATIYARVESVQPNFSYAVPGDWVEVDYEEYVWEDDLSLLSKFELAGELITIEPPEYED